MINFLSAAQQKDKQKPPLPNGKGGFSFQLLVIHRTTESDVACRAVWRIFTACCNAIPIAVRTVAQVRAAAKYPRISRWRANRVVPFALHMVVRAEPIGAPLPHVARHVIQAIGIRLERFNRRRACVAVTLVVFVRKLTLPNVTHMSSAWLKLISPGIALLG